MDKNGLLVVFLFLFMIVFDQSNALNSRKLVTTPDPNGSSKAIQDSPSSSPPPDDKKSNPFPVEAPKPKDNPNTNSSDVESKGLNDANTKTSSENSSDKSQDGKEKVDNQMQSNTFASKSCKGKPICSDQEKTMIACIQDIENGSNKLTLLVQNERDVSLKVNITFGTSMNNYLPALEIPGHATEKVNITFAGDKSTKVILNAGNGDCELQIGQLKSTPVNEPPKPKDINDPAKPKQVNNPTDSPAKPKDVTDPEKPKESNSPAKPKEVETAKPKDVDDPAKPKESNSPAKPKEVEETSKPKDVDDPAKPKEVEEAAKPKEVEEAAKPKTVDGPAKPMEDFNNTSKVKEVDVGPPLNSESAYGPPISQSNLLDQLSFYSKQVTPMYGAYFAFLVALVIGGSWALCSFKKRRTDGGVPYQELEMGLPESSNAVDVETTESWDQDWDDDDWDEDKAIRSPGGGMRTKTISSNGLTSRGVKKDGWDADWDD